MIALKQKGKYNNDQSNSSGPLKYLNNNSNNHEFGQDKYNLNHNATTLLIFIYVHK